MFGKRWLTRQLIVQYSRGLSSSSSSSSSSSNQSLRLFHVLGVQQIALGSSNKQQLGDFWGTLMGLEMVRS